MNKVLYYPPADSKTQNFVSKYPGREISPNVLVIHTMECGGWPSYQNGGVAPHLSLRLYLNNDGTLSKFAWRQHFPFNRTARAVLNKSGGVETNNSTQGVIQIELNGTCGWSEGMKPNWADPEQMKKVAKPLIDFLVFCKTELGIQLVAPYNFYPYNGHGHRMSYHEWLSFKGICGHQHVPENSHVDPGLIDIDWLIEEAKKVIDGTSTPIDPPGGTDSGSGDVSIPNAVKITKKFDKPTIKLLQYIIGLRGDDVDGVWGPVTKKNFQKWLFMPQNLIIGIKVVTKLQIRVGVPKDHQDGLWGPETNGYLQNYLNRKREEKLAAAL
jgi:hypothetical protein